MKKIMVVDDNKDLIQTVRFLLEKESGEYTVIGADSGNRCFELLKSGHIPDLILLDFYMPDMDGWAVLDKLKAKKSPYNHIPIILLTVASDEILKDVRVSLVDDYIAKPFEVTELTNRIIKVMKNQ